MAAQQKTQSTGGDGSGQFGATQIALSFICVCLTVYVLFVGRDIFVPFMIAVCFWYLINALARGFSSFPIGVFKMPRVVSFILAILTLWLALWGISALIGNNIASVVAAAPVYRENFETVVPKLLAFFGLEEQQSIEAAIAYFNPASFIGLFAQTFTGIAGKTLVVLFYTGFLLYEQQFFKHKIAQMITSDVTEHRVNKILKTIDLQIQRYIWVKTFISAMTGLCTWGLLAYLKVDFAQFWGLMAFFLNFIPYVGSLVAIIVPTLIALIQFSDVSIATYVLVGLSIIQLSWGSVLDPRLMGDSLNISPICIILSLAMWGSLWGIPGMFLSIPILAMIVITLSQFERTRPIAILPTKTGDIDGK